MYEPYIGGIVLFAGNFAPRGWAFCQGQLFSIAEYQALFSLLGTTYGGDGVNTFALPDLRGRAPVCQGQLNGGNYYDIGQVGGAASHTLLANQLPAHSHDLQITMQVQVSNAAPSSDEAEGSFLTNSASPFYSGQKVGNGTLGGATATGATGPTGGNQPFNNRSPYLVINYIIALEGIYPSRN